MLHKYVYERGRHLGEWLEPEEFQDKIGPGRQLKQTEVATAYFHYDMALMAEIAAALGESADAVRYQEYARGSQMAYRQLFLANGAPDTDRQAKLVRPLALGLADGDDELTQLLRNRLALAVEHRQYCIGTGFLSTPFVLHELTKAGRTDLAYRMLENEQSPGWLHEVNEGATTIWEDWEGTVSHNHYSPGAVCQWLFETVGGIQPDGEKSFVLRPIPGGTLTWAEAAYKSLYGEIKSCWNRNGDKVTLSVTIPSNTSVKVILPDGQTHQCSAGSHEFTWKQVQS